MLHKPIFIMFLYGGIPKRVILQRRWIQPLRFGRGVRRPPGHRPPTQKGHRLFTITETALQIPCLQLTVGAIRAKDLGEFLS